MQIVERSDIVVVSVKPQIGNEIPTSFPPLSKLNL